MVDQWEERTEVKSMSDSTKTYTVARRKRDGVIGCSCGKWVFHKAPKVHCKHILALLEAIASVSKRSRIFLDGLEFSPALYVAKHSFPEPAIVDKVMGRSNLTMQVAVAGEQFQVSRIFLEE